MFFAVLFMKAIKLDITQILINTRKIDGVFIHGVLLYSIGNEWATVTYINMDECREIQCWVKIIISGIYFIKLQNKQK